MFKRHQRKFFVISVIGMLLVLFVTCMNKEGDMGDVRGADYAGAGKCIQCHKSVYNSYQNTAHNRTSDSATRTSVKGSFAGESNTYFYKPGVKVQMEDRGDGLYQVAFKDEQEKQASRFDIAIGSGRKAQTFLYWAGEKIYQLPLSYSVAANSWVNSPGYPPRQVRFDRNIPIGCFECHSSNIEVKSNEAAGAYYINNYNKKSLIYGIDCERCHGPAAKHVNFHQQHSTEKTAKFITALSAMSGMQQIDRCAVCHAGIQESEKSSFAFMPGDTLSNNFHNVPADRKADELDVHGNQTQLMMASLCFKKSTLLTCSSCHNTHTNERNNLVLLSKKCMSCHNTANNNFCSVKTVEWVRLADNCIDCHMPAKPSKSIQLLSNGQHSPTPNLVRTHYIAIYPEESKKFLLVKNP